MAHAPRSVQRKLAVCYPGDASFVFMQAFENIVAIETPDDCEVRWFRGVGWCQARRRVHAAEQAVEWGADLICCLDLDQIYESDILKRLVARHDEGHDVIAAMVPMRGYVASSKMLPFQRLAWKFHNREFVPVDPADGDVQQCEFPTSAAILFSTADLLKLRKPWYFFTYKPDTWEQVHGEDASFVLRMQSDAGVKAWVDTTIKVKHAHVFQIDETYPERFADWAKPGVGEAAICDYGEANQ